MKSVCALITALLSASVCADKTDADDDAARIFSETCVACHGEGVRGAPRPGVKADWEPRLSYGIEELYLNAADGVGANMPPRGLCFDCTDSQLRAVVDYMVRDLK
ncbi:MAG: c-type cytochrome [Pseudomonadales bacterium]|nr:c-type cytochrome [Pseudomonadales bacterium]MDP7596981.1 c-type cytochrome [Pseudomonadales bacterium]HJN50839.1 c-type cytochrome [Pseudomonadales bacterium]